MKVAFIGNTCNQSFQNILLFREFGVSGTLFYDIQGHPQTFPESQNPEIGLSRPDWICPFDSTQLGENPWNAPSSALLKAIQQHDVIHCEGGYLPWAQAANIPYVWWACGGDAQHYPFIQGWLWLGFPLAEAIIRTVEVRRAIARAGQINLGQWLPVGLDFEHLLRNFPLKYKLQREILPIDTDLFSPSNTGPDVNTLLERCAISAKAKGLIIFNPTRIMFTEKSTYNYGSDALLRILKVLKQLSHTFTLIVTRKNNVDEPEFERLIEKFGLRDNIIWIPSQARKDLIDWYRASDLVANDFGFGGIGSISIESMACGTSLLTAVKTEYDDPTFEIPDVATSYPPPVFLANSEEEAIRNLILCCKQPEELNRRGEACRQWVLDNCSAASIAPRYIAMYQRAIDNFPISPPPCLSKQVRPGEFINSLKTCTDAPSLIASVLQTLNDSPESPVVLEFLISMARVSGQKLMADTILSATKRLGIPVVPERYERLFLQSPFRSIAAGMA